MAVGLHQGPSVKSSQDRRSWARAPLWISTAAAALLVSGCVNIGSLTRGVTASSGIAEVQNDNPEVNAANIASLTEVVEKSPTNPVAYNTRGSVYARTGQYQPCARFAANQPQ